MYNCDHIKFEHIKIEGKANPLGSESTIHTSDHIWLEHLKKVSNVSLTRIQ